MTSDWMGLERQRWNGLGRAVEGFRGVDRQRRDEIEWTRIELERGGKGGIGLAGTGKDRTGWEGTDGTAGTGWEGTGSEADRTGFDGNPPEWRGWNRRGIEGAGPGRDRVGLAGIGRRGVD